MNGAPPPPPPPHGDNPHTTGGHYRKSSDLPPGNYDIFVVPPHSAGSGFLYLPSLQCHRNSFLAGAASTLFVVLLWTTLTPIMRTWYATTVTSGSGMGMVLLALGVGVAGWAFGIAQSDGDNGNSNGNSRGFGGSFGGFGAGGPNTNQSSGANYGKGSQFGGNGSGQQYGSNFSGAGPNRGNQYSGNQYGSGAPPNQDQNNHGPNGAEWERAREETRRKEELRRKMEEFKRKRDAEAKAKENEREVAAKAKAKAEKEAAETEAATKTAAQKEAMAKFAALKEAAAKKMAEKKGQEARKAGSPFSAPRTPSPKKPPFPTARTATEEDDAYSFRPYDRPRRPYGVASVSSEYSESSYAPSQSTAHTTPPPSHRTTYSTKDPDKIVIQGVYAFNNAFVKTPVAQLVSGQGLVTDGLVLRITTEGLFVDDDVRGVGQREWDIKAWTMKLAEIWCPQMTSSTSSSAKPGSSNPFSFRRSGAAHAVPTSEESEAFLAGLLKVCKNTCRLASPSACFARSANASGIHEGGAVHPPQSSEFRGLHVLRATLRDQESKRYVFVMQETEAWKLAIGLQRLRSGSQVRALGVSSMPAPECKTTLGGLGYI